MEVKSWQIWSLFGITILIIVIVIYVNNKVDDCCEEPGPGEGPIIVVQPTDDGAGHTVASWTLKGVSIPSWGTSGYLREELFGEVETFTFKAVGCLGYPTCQLQRLEIIIVSASTGQPHTLVVEKTSSNTLAWSMDTYALTGCDFGSAPPPNCTNTGVPSEFNGTITSITATEATTSGPPNTYTTVELASIQASR